MGRGKASGERGVILLVVIWLLALISVIVLSVAQNWRTEVILTRNYYMSRQASLLAEGGVYYALGKLVEAQIAERGRRTPSVFAKTSVDLWKGDGVTHHLQVPGGKVAVRITDESGKINVNRASEQVLLNLMTSLGYDEKTARSAVAAIMDWRDRDNLSRTGGMETQYYGSLNPPYMAKNGPLDTVEELFWVRGINPTQFARLRQFLTVQKTGRRININAAPVEVLQALGLTLEQALNVVQTRQLMAFRNRRELNNLVGGSRRQRFNAPLTFRSSQFFEIVATGMVEYPPRRGRHTIKALVRINANRPLPWDFLLWADDYLG